MKDSPMNEDIKKYPIFLLSNGKLRRIYNVKSTDDYNHFILELHHFLGQTIRKNDPEFYKKVEHLQKLIFLKKDTHRGLPNYTDKKCLTETGMNKRDLMFIKDEWKSSYYEENEKK